MRSIIKSYQSEDKNTIADIYRVGALYEVEVETVHGFEYHGPFKIKSAIETAKRAVI